MIDLSALFWISPYIAFLFVLMAIPTTDSRG